MRNSDIAEFKQNRHIANLIAEFQRKLNEQENEPFFVSFDDVSAQIETHIIDVGFIGIEIVKVLADPWGEENTRVDLYTKNDDDWLLCHRQRIDGYDTVEIGVWETIAAYRNKLERKVKNEKKRKYRKGDRVKTVDELLNQQLVYWHDKITPRGWFMSWQLKMAYNAVSRGEIYKAIRKDEADA